MKNTLLTNWNFSRALRLIFSLIIAYQAINHKDPIAGFLSVLLLFQSFTNTGCCGSSCAIPTKKM